MPVEFTRNRYNELVRTAGRTALNALFPNDLEIYLMALELTDGEGNTIDYFVFPITPDQISKSVPMRTNIKKTSSGNTVYTSNSYVPQEIQIKGNFGRHFKILLSPKEPGGNAVAYSTGKGVFDLTQVNDASSRGLTLNFPAFSIGVKTGYGATRILQAIVNKSNGVDQKGQPFRLYFYNLALGESYLVVVPPSGLILQQTLQTNMIWQYTLNLTTLAPLNALVNRSGPTSLVTALSTGLLQQSVNIIANNLTPLIG